MPRAYLAAATTLAIAVACKGPAVPHPLVNQFRYTCCNLHYEKPEITDANYLRGTVIPFGTRVQILEVAKDSVKFEAPGYPPITLLLESGARTLSMEQYLERIFLVDSPFARLPTPTLGSEQAAETDKTRRMIEEGAVGVGMTRDQVLMAIGYPPADRTPSLDAPTWKYWANPRDTFEIHFEGDKVSRVRRRHSGSGRGWRRRGA